MIDYNSLGLPVASQLYLCRPDNTVVCVLNGAVPSSCICNKQIRNLWTLDVDIKKYIGNNSHCITSNGYQSIRNDMRIFVDGVGFFIINNVTVRNDRINEIKSISATSLASELRDKILRNIKINCGTEDSQEYLVSGNISNIITTSHTDVRDTSIANEYIEFYRDTSYLDVLSEYSSDVGGNKNKDYIMKALYRFPKLIEYINISVAQSSKNDILNVFKEAKLHYESESKDVSQLIVYISEFENGDVSEWSDEEYKNYKKILYLYPYVYQQFFDKYGEIADSPLLYTVVNVCSVDGEYLKDGYSDLSSYYKQLSLLDIIIQKSNCNWSVGAVDSSVSKKKFSFDIDEQDIYSFLVNDLSKTSEAVFTFDNIHRKINVTSIENLGVDTNIHVQYRNLLNQLNISPDESYTYTRYSVSGDNGLNIDYVNFGNSYIDNLDYYLNAKDENGNLIYMTSELAEKYKLYVQYRESMREQYIDLTNQYNELLLKRDELVNRVPNDYCATEWNTVDDESLEKMRIGFRNLKSAIEALYFADYPDRSTIVDEEIKETFYWHDWYAYTYIIIPSIEIEQANRLNGSSYVNDNAEAYLTEWSLYGLDELNVRLADLKNQKQSLERSEVIYNDTDWYAEFPYELSSVCDIASYINKPNELPNVFNKNSLVYSIPLSTLKDYLISQSGFTTEKNKIIIGGVFGYSQSTGLERNTAYVSVSVDELGDGKYKDAIYGGTTSDNNGIYYWVYINDENDSQYVTIFVHYGDIINATSVETTSSKTRIQLVAVSKEIFDGYKEIEYNAIKDQYAKVCSDVLSCQNAINDRQLEVDAVDESMSNINENRLLIAEACSTEKWTNGGSDPAFTREELDVLNLFIKETAYENKNIVKTDLDDIVTEVDIQRSLLEKAQEELSIASQPQLHFDVEMENLFTIKEFQILTKNFDIGNFVWVEYRDGHEVKLRLIGVEYNPMIPNDKLRVEFSNFKRSNIKCNDFIDLLDKSLSSTRSGSSGSSGGSSVAHESEIRIDNNLLRAMLKSDYFGTSVKNVVINSLNVEGDALFNMINSKTAKYNDLKNGTTEINGGCIKSGAIVSDNYNGSITKKTTEQQDVETGIYNYGIDNTSGSIINLSDGYFNFAGGGLKYDGSSLKVRGNIYAEDGEIGDLVLEGGSLRSSNDNYSVTFRGVNSDNTGEAVFYITDNTGEEESYPFRINGNGTVVAEKLYLYKTVRWGDKGGGIMSSDDCNVFCPETTDSHTTVGYGRYNNNKGGTIIYGGNEVGIRSKEDFFISTADGATVFYNNKYETDSSGNYLHNLYVGRSNNRSATEISTGATGIVNARNTIIRGSTVRIYAHSGVSQSTPGGAVYLGSTGSIAITSDENFKTLGELDNRYENFFMSLSPKTYKYKSHGHRFHIGFGARGVEQCLINAGLTTEDFAGVLIDKGVTLSADELGEDEGRYFDEIYSLRYEEFIALNTHMIQKAFKKIYELEHEIKMLKQNT